MPDLRLFPTQRHCTRCGCRCKPDGDFDCDCPAGYRREVLAFWLFAAAALGLPLLAALCLLLLP